MGVLRRLAALAPAAGLAVVLTLGWPAAAEAGPVAAAVGAIGSWIGGAWAAVGAVGGGLIGGALQQVLIGVGLSVIGRAMQGEPATAARGATLTVQAGGDLPQTVILGRFATAGRLAWSGSHTLSEDSTPNNVYTEVVVLSVLPGLTLRRVQVNGAWATLGATAHPDYGLPVAEFNADGQDTLWIRFHGSGRSTPDPMLRAKYGDLPEWSWAADMVGRGVAFAIVTARWHDELHRGQAPKVLFEVDGIPCYNRRSDSTAGGAGPQRRDDRATWATYDNPVVIIETLLGPGLRYGGEPLYGPQWPAVAFPASRWVAAANACDVDVALSGGGAQRAYRCGLELDLGSEPIAVVRELLKCCAGDMAECEGRVLIHVGPAGAAAMSVYDEDLALEEPQSFEPFRGLSQTYNGATATFSDPAQGWTSQAAPPRTHPEWEAEDGDRRQVVALAYPWVWQEAQAQRLMEAALLDNRRQRSHRVVLPPRFGALEPLDFVAWTSARNGYLAKLFRVTEAVDDPSGWIGVTLLEEDPDDYDWEPGMQLPYAPPAVPLPVLPAAGVPGWGAAPYILLDGGGAERRPAIRLTWTPGGLDGVRAIKWERRVAGATAVVPGSTAAVELGEAIVSDGIIAGQAYEVRGWLDAPGQSVVKTGWTAVTAPVVLVATADVAPQAINVPVQTFRPGKVQHTTTTLVTVAEVAISRLAGIKTNLIASCAFDARGDVANLVLALYRGSVLVRRGSAATGEDGRGSQMALPAVDDDAAGGPATYSLKAAKALADDPQVQTWDVLLQAIQHKR